MLVFVEQKHIDLGQVRNNGLSRGQSCPISRAISEQLGVPLDYVYTGTDSVCVQWSRHYNTVYKLDRKAAGFVAWADSDAPMKPVAVALIQEPNHGPMVGRHYDTYDWDYE